MNKKYTQQEQDEAWRKYRIRRILIPILVFAIAGLYFLGKEGVKKYKQHQVTQNHEINIKEIIHSPSKDSYFILTNKYRDYSLQSTNSTLDSISFKVCQSSEERFSWKMADLFNACKNSTKNVTIAKTDLLKSMCNEKETNGKFCQLIPELHPQAPFKIRSGFNFNGVNLKISMGWNIKETKQKEITFVNEGLPLKIKEIRSSYGEIKLVNKNLPVQLNSNAKISMIVPIKRGFLPNRNYNRYNPYDFDILVETEKNGEELYKVTFKNDNLVVNSNHLIED